jgi:hypothetical protein
LKVNDVIGYDKDEASEFLINVLKSKNLIIEHPELNVPTFARSSKIIGMANVIHFSDGHLNNHWYLIQVTKLVEAYSVNGKFYNPSRLPAAERVKEFIDSDKLKFDLKVNTNTVNGLLFSQTRPFHYFYDQYVNYFTLSSFINIDEYCYSDDKCFYSRFKSTSFKKASSNGCYLFPCTIPRNIDGDDAKKMNTYLKGSEFTGNMGSELSIWIGITGQKRSWIEQVDGYVNIIKQLSGMYSSISVFVDGWTNYELDISVTKEDVDIFNDIKNQLSTFSSVQIISLINKDYKDKIKYANSCDYFIANSGTGCMVPFAICNKKGVIHGNGRVNTFKKIYNENIREVVKKTLTPIQVDAPMYTSYSINWEVIFNCLMDLMNKSFRMPYPKLESVKTFSQLTYTENTQPVDALRDIAIAFYETGDTKTAYKIMCKALDLRPKGPFIRQKIKEWSKK